MGQHVEVLRRVSRVNRLKVALEGARLYCGLALDSRKIDRVARLTAAYQAALRAARRQQLRREGGA